MGDRVGNGAERAKKESKLVWSRVQAPLLVSGAVILLLCSLFLPSGLVFLPCVVVLGNENRKQAPWVTRTFIFFFFLLMLLVSPFLLLGTPITDFHGSSVGVFVSPP